MTAMPPEPPVQHLKLDLVDHEDDREEIEAAIATYLEWVRTGDPALRTRVFHRDATVVNASRGDGDVAVWPIVEFARRVERLRSEVGVVEETARSTQIDVARLVASVRLDFNLRLGDQTFSGTDFFSLARADGRWLITHKNYDGDRPL
jgi:hypothetical protein